MQHGLRLPDFSGRKGGPTAAHPAFWRSMARGGLIALGVILVLSTQFLFQLELYDAWSLRDILLGWLDYLLDLATVGACIFAAVAAVASLQAGSGASRHVLILGSLVLGAFAGEGLLALRGTPPPDVSTAEILLAKIARWLVLGGLAYAAYVYQRRAADAAARAHESRLHGIQLDRQMTEARLQSLRAQIEPHFVFNTLANIHRLYQTDPGRGRSMLANFLAYLRAALPHMRHDETTLQQEVDLTRAYLDVLQVRMGERLRFRLDIPQTLASLPFPPFALSTLTENAIKHGLNPLPGGGTIEISARIENRALRVEVADTGMGLKQSSGSGAGIANLRARLAALYGDAAHLNIEANAPRGIRATIAVPVRATAGNGG